MAKDGKTVKIKIDDKVYEWGDVQMGRCTLSYHGGDPQVSPFIHKSLPGYSFDVTQQNVSEIAAYKLCWPFSLGTWAKTQEDPSGYVVEGHARMRDWGGDSSYGVGGSRGCMRSCFDHLEKRGKIEQTFEGGPFIKRPRWLLPHCVEPMRPTGRKEAGLERTFSTTHSPRGENAPAPWGNVRSLW